MTECRREHLGSPPPTRGILTNQATAEDAAGITPAYAGNTAIHAMAQDGEKDHPRLRGEHLIRLSLTIALSGSPPPTRGTLYDFKFPADGVRITPAYAGNTITPLRL